MDWTNVITVIIALYGAILSTYTFIVSYKSKKRQISVVLSRGFVVLGTSCGPLNLFIKVSNPGDRPVTISCPTLLLPDRKSLVFTAPNSDVTFPYELQEGKNCSVWEEMSKIENAIRESGNLGELKVYAVVSDATGKEYKSKKPFKVFIPKENNNA